MKKISVIVSQFALRSDTRGHYTLQNTTILREFH